MASEAITNGTSSADHVLTPAERMMQEQTAAEETAAAHKATVEDVVDEDTLAHPPPSGAVASDVTSTTLPATEDKGTGKQPAREKLDTASEDMFPTLGASKAKAAAPSMWSKKPAAVGKAAGGIANGFDGQAVGGAAQSRAATPASGIVTPSHAAPSHRGPAPVMIPGRYSEQISLDPSMMIPRAQLKKPLPEILRDINKRSKATVEMKNGPGGMAIFEGTGPVDAVRAALKETASQLCSRQTATVPIPSSIRGRVVGKQGATIQAISKKTGARINISKQEAAEILEDDDVENMVDVTIEGDPLAVEIAKQDIEKIVNEHTSSLNTRIKHIPAEYYPFLAGPYNARINALQEGRDLKVQIPHYYTWNRVAPPQSNQDKLPVLFTAQDHLPIQLSGDRQIVNEIKAELDRQVQELERQLTLDELEIERGRHQFIAGDRGSAIHDFLQETGCSVILPPDHDDTELLTIIGPAEKIEDAKEKIMELAASMASANADIARTHANAPRGAQVHAQDVTRYLQQRRAIQQLEQLHNARIVPNSTGAWQIYSREGKDAMKARSDIMNLISGHPPARFHPVQVDPFYYQHLQQQAAAQLREQYGVQMVVPGEHEDGPLLLVYEDLSPAAQYELPRRKPSPQEAQSFQQALQAAQQHVLGLMSGQQDIISRDVDAPVKFHDKIRRHVDRYNSGLPSGQFPSSVTFGGPQPAGGKRAAAPNVGLRGPQDSVDALMQNLLSFIEQEKQDELERGFTLSFDYPQKFANHLIGRRGENINRIREEFDVDIQLDDGKCQIKGPEAKANACKKHIIDLAKKLEDEATHHLNIPAQFHRDLIGAAGSQINRLQDRYHVRINFPRNKQAEDDVSNAGDRRNDQQPNEVIVKGPSKGADACRDELLSLVQYLKDNSFVATVSVAQNQLPSLIGAGGKEMEAMRLETGAQIDVPGSRDAVSPNGRAEIRIKGSKKAVEEAKKLIEEKAKVFDNTVTRELDVDRKFHRLIIGAQGSNLRGIISQAGGPEDQRQHNRMVRFPKTDAEGNTIRIEGQKAVVDKISAAIEKLVSEQESQVTEIAEVKPDKHRLLIGRGGETRRQLEQQFGVTINVPRQSETGPQRSQVRIAGQPSNVEKAKAHILEITKEQEGETVSIPRRFHHAIADNGQFFRRMRTDHKITVDHNGQRPPPKPTAPTPTRANGTAMPLITDEPGANANAHSWEMHDLHASAEEGEIPWVLSGPSPEALTAARAKLDRALEEARKQDTIGFLILPDPRAYRHVIGPGGAEINRIRKQTGTKIQVPRDQSKGEAIEIAGSKAGCQEARDIILEIVQNNHL